MVVEEEEEAAVSAPDVAEDSEADVRTHVPFQVASVVSGAVAAVGVAAVVSYTSS